MKRRADRNHDSIFVAALVVVVVVVVVVVLVPPFWLKRLVSRVLGFVLLFAVIFFLFLELAGSVLLLLGRP